MMNHYAEIDEIAPPARYSPPISPPGNRRGSLSGSFSFRQGAGQGSAPVLGPLPFVLYRDIDSAPAKAWLIDDMLGKGELSIWYGAPGCGKSVLIGDAACHVAAGKEWHGRRVEGGTVLYVAAERGALVKRRFAAWRKHHGIDDLPLAVVAGFFDLCMAGDDTSRLLATAASLAKETGKPVRWIIIDTVAQVLAGGDENSGRDMGALVGNLGRLQQETGAHVTAIHHVPQFDPQRMRGHGALAGAADSTFRVTKGEACRLVEIDKVNDGPDEIKIGFTLQSVTLSIDPETDKETSAPVVLPFDMPDMGRTRQNVRLTDKEELLKRYLAEALAEAGSRPPESTKAPAGITAIPLKDWRTYCYKRGFCQEEKADTRLKAFNRASDALQRKGIICIREDWAWLI